MWSYPLQGAAVAPHARKYGKNQYNKYNQFKGEESNRIWFSLQDPNGRTIPCWEGAHGCIGWSPIWKIWARQAAICLSNGQMEAECVQNGGWIFHSRFIAFYRFTLYNTKGIWQIKKMSSVSCLRPPFSHPHLRTKRPMCSHHSVSQCRTCRHTTCGSG